MTREEARALLSQAVGATREMALFPFEFGWAAQARLTPEEIAQGMSVGLGVYIIDQNGTVTVHRSLPPKLIMEEYAEARRQGRITGQEIWPNRPPARTVDPRWAQLNRPPTPPAPSPGPRPPML